MRKPPTRPAPATERRTAEANQRRVAEIERAGGRVGRTVDDEVRWVIAFTERELARTTTAERLVLGEELLAFGGRITPDGLGIAAGALDAFVEPPSDDTLGWLHRQLRGGLAALRAGQRWTLPSGRPTWRPSAFSLRGVGGAAGRVSVVRAYDVGGIEDAVLVRVADLLTRCTRLRQCPECDRLFVARRRQERHSQCARKARDARRPSRQRNAPAPAGIVLVESRDRGGRLSTRPLRPSR